MIPPLLALLTPAWVGSSSSSFAGGLFLNNLEEQVKKKKDHLSFGATQLWYK